MYIGFGFCIYFALGALWLFNSEVRSALWFPTQTGRETMNVDQGTVDVVDRVSDYTWFQLVRIYVLVTVGYFLVWPIVVYEHILFEWAFNIYGSVRNWLGIYDDSQFSARPDNLIKRYSIQEFGRPPFKIRMKEGDEIWSYCTKQDTWNDCAGSMGFALIRDGKIIGEHETTIN